MADTPETTTVTLDSAGQVVDLDAEPEDPISPQHWRIGRWLKFVVHRQRGRAGGLRDVPIAVFRSAALARLAVDEVNGSLSPYPWSVDQARYRHMADVDAADAGVFGK